MMNKLNSYVWKEKKQIISKTDFEQCETKMIDMSEIKLKTAYEHCKDMLYNDSKKDPGRYLVLNEISTQINNCAAELAVRWFCLLVDDKQNLKYSRFSLLNEIKSIVEIISIKYPKDHVFRLQDIYDDIPVDFKPITIESILKSCKDTLGKMNINHITKSFIIRQGIWFTAEVIKDFKEIEKLRDVNQMLDVVKERLKLNNTEIKLKSSGLSYNQFRAMINLKISKKYSELTTIQLETLKNKLLFILEEQVLFHIMQWQTLMGQIEEVCEYKGFKL